ncbi:MAG: hypothetical protein E7673_00295 [Ruminococcaceae bacterium]|nr:hypothetical protein [Oscillospiraceae bacterium]
MSLLEKIYSFLSFEIEAPKTYGIFHLISVAFVIVLTTILCKKCIKSSENTERKLAFWFWVILAVFEIYKQFIYLFDTSDGFVVDYAWHGFPFQLCSSPLYVLPLIAFLPSGKIREAFVAFYGTFVLLGGIAVYIYPGNVFTETLGINVHTMLWHGSQIFLGIYFNLRRFASKDSPDFKKYYASAVPIFLLFITVAVMLNEIFFKIFTAKGMDDEFNMFFISPHFECMFPVLDTIQANTPYPVFLFSYILILSAFSFAILYVEAFFAKRHIEKTKIKG